MTLFLLISHIQSDCFAVKVEIIFQLSSVIQRGACRVEHNHNHNQCKPQSKRSWGQHRFICHAVDDWKALPDGVRNISNFLVFRRLIRNM